MRYREGEELPLTQYASDDMLLLTAVLGTFIGIILTLLGKFGKQMWMFVWGIGLVLISVYLGVSVWLELDFPY
ncbi:MAG: hypothetical protein KTR16_16890 [Acidiferrobacterales bacterium]|nr:hypothetical protein [Acidiferrobacterales bacterium]